MADNTKKIVTIRKGINGFAFSICNENGNLISNINSTKEAYELYEYEIKHGRLKIKKETTLYPANAENYIVPGKNYGYVRVSSPKQSIDRQIRNIKEVRPDAIIIQEVYTGTKMDRPEWNKYYRKFRNSDTITFDSVSRMARNAEEGTHTYFELYDRGVELYFLKEPHINTVAYKEALKGAINVKVNSGDKATDTLVNSIMEAVNVFMRAKVRADIEKAFEQAEKEVKDLQQRTREGIETARINGKQIGQKPGNTLEVKKKAPAKEIIEKHSKSFGGTLSDGECMKLAGVSRNTYYKYKKEISQDKFDS